MHLSLRQLETFREVMLSGSISQAARTMGRTQPAVSTMITKLEEELRFALFIRQQGKLVPTPEAHYFLEEAEAVLARLERTKQTLDKLGSLEVGKLRIACHPAASGFFMPRILNEFLKDKEEVQVSLMMRSSDVIEDLIASRQFDIGFAETPRRRSSIDRDDFNMECVCIMPAGDPLARQRVIEPKDLDGLPMALLYEEHPISIQTEAAFLAAKCGLIKRLELRTFLPGLQFVAQGFCYMICDMITAHSHLTHGSPDMPLTIRRFSPKITNSVSIIRPAHVSQSLIAKSFSAHIIRAIQSAEEDVERHCKL